MDLFDKIAREKWLAERRKGIGGSEVAAVLGISPWQSPAEVWARKKGLIPEQPDSLRFKIGRKFEGPIAELYAERENVQLSTIVGSIRDDVHHVFGTPDRLVKNQNRGVEVKTADPMTSFQWGEEGSDEIPLYYATQVATYMSLTGYPEWDVAVLFGTSDFRVYRLHRDLELERMILQRCKEFWEKYVIGNEEPPPDESKAYSSYLLSKYPANTKGMDTATEHETLVMQDLFDVRYDIAELEKKEAKLQNILKARIGKFDGLQSNVGKILWKKVKDREVVDWEAAAREMGITGELISKHTSIKEGYRRFNVYPAKGLAKVE